MELPRYTLKSHVLSLVLPHCIALLGLGILGFVLFSLNLWAFVEPDGFTYVLLALAILLGMGIFGIQVYQRAQGSKYHFFSDRIVGKGLLGMQVHYADIGSVSCKQSMLDKWFGTCRIVLTPKHALTNVPLNNQVYFYIQKMIEFNRRQP